MPNMDPKKCPMPSQDPNVRNKNFLEVALGYTEEQARELIETDGDEKNRFRAAMLLDLTADHLYANNTFTEE